MCIYFSDLTIAQQATVKAIFEDPFRADIPWNDVLDLLNSFNGSVSINVNVLCAVIRCQRQSSRIGIFNRIEGTDYVGSHMVSGLRDMLSDVGIEPY